MSLVYSITKEALNACAEMAYFVSNNEHKYAARPFSSKHKALKPCANMTHLSEVTKQARFRFSTVFNGFPEMPGTKDR